MPNREFFSSRGAYVNYAIMAILLLLFFFFFFFNNEAILYINTIMKQYYI